MLQVILKFDQNWKQFWHQNRLKFDQKSIKKWHRIQSWFWNQYFFDFWSIFDLFWTNFGAFLDPKSLQNRFQSGFGSVPDPQVASKGRLDPTWNRSGSILGAFLTNFFKILDKILINFSIKAMYIRIYLHTSVVPIPLTSLASMCKHTFMEFLKTSAAKQPKVALTVGSQSS